MSNYYLNFVNSIQNILSEIEIESIPMYMIKWNTLVGRDFVISTFFRSALILDAILSIFEKIEGIGFPLNTYEQYFDNREEANLSSLGLFLNLRIKRPAYFVIEAILRLGAFTLYNQGNILITQGINNEIVIILYNPQSIDPLMSIDSHYLIN